jgi:hypothetical protein
LVAKEQRTSDKAQPMLPRQSHKHLASNQWLLAPPTPQGQIAHTQVLKALELASEAIIFL